MPQAPYQVVPDVPKGPDMGGPPSLAAAAPVTSATSAAPSTPAQRLKSPAEFGAAVRKQYPGVYDHIPDDLLTHAIVKQYPEYQAHVVDIYQGADQARLPKLPGGGGKPGAPPDPNSFMSTGDKVIADLGDAAAQVGQLAGNIYGMPGVTTSPTLEDVPKFLQQPVMSPVTGTKRAVEGVTEALNAPPVFKPGQPPPGYDEVQQQFEPYAKIIGGLMEAGELGLVPAVMAAPWATMGALVVGTGVTTGVQKGLTAVGAPPAFSEVVADLAGVAAGGLAGHRIAARGAAAEASRVAGINETIGGAELIRQNRAGEMAAEDFNKAAEDSFTKAKEDAFAALAVNRGLLEVAKAAQDKGVGSKSPFDYLNEATAAQRASEDQLAAARAGRESQIIDPSRMLPEAPPEVLNPLRRGPGEVPADSLGPGVADAGAPPTLSTLPEEISAGADVQAAGPPVPPEPVLEAQAGPPRGTPEDFFQGLDTEVAMTQADRDLAARRSLQAQPDPGARLLPDRTFEARAYSAEPRPIDEVGPPRVPKPELGPPPEPTSDPLVDKLASEFESSLTPPSEDPAVIEGRRRAELQQAVPAEMASMLEDNPHISGGLIDSGVVDQGGQEGRTYQSATPSSKVFEEITKGAKNPPPVSLITDILRVLADTGAQSAKDIPPAKLLALRKAKGYGPREFLNAYNRWMPEVQRVRDSMVSSKIAQERRTAALRRGDYGDRVRELKGAPPPEPGQIGFDEGAPPMPPKDDLPDFLRDLEADPSAQGAYDEVQGVLPGAEAVRETENPTPEFEAPFTLNQEAATGPSGEHQVSLWDALKSDTRRLISEEEGALKFTVDPNDETAVRRWLRGKVAEYGHESWHEQATNALAEGDLDSAARIISIASAKSHMAAAAVSLAKKDKTPKEAKAAAIVNKTIDEYRDQYKKDFETRLGMDLPLNVDVTPDGFMTFQPGGKGVPAIRVSATDRLLGVNVLAEVNEAADPTQIIRVGLSDDVAKEHQIGSQIHQQILTEWPDAKVRKLGERVGLGHLSTSEVRIELARHADRSLSIMARAVGDVGRYAQQHEDSFYQLVKVGGGSGEDVGPVSHIMAEAGIVDPDGFSKWVGKAATPDQLDAMRFRLPRGVQLHDAKGNLTKGAEVYAKNFFRKNERLQTTQDTINRLVGEQGNALDRAVVSAMLSPLPKGYGSDSTPGRIAAMNGLSKSALISTPGNMIRNSISQGVRYASGAADEAVAATFSLLTGNPDQATYHARNMRYLAQGLTRKGTSSLNLFRHPWAEGLEATYNLTADAMIAAPPELAWKTLGLLAEVPHQEARLLGALGLEEADPIKFGEGRADLPISKYKALAAVQKSVDFLTQPAVRNSLTLLNRVQEHFWRATVYDSMMRAQIEARGLDAFELLAGDPHKLIDAVGAEEFERMAGAAVSTALDYTFASNPLPGTAPHLLLQGLQKVPIISWAAQMGVPFPRFQFVSAPRWVWDHSPIMPVADLALNLLSMVRPEASDYAQFGRGRYFQMLENRRATQTLLDLDMHIGQSRYDMSIAEGKFNAARDAADQGKKILRGITTRAQEGGILPEIESDIARIKSQLAAHDTEAIVNRAKVKELDARVKNLTASRKNVEANVSALQEVGAAKSPQEYFARVATGTAAMAAFYAMWQYKASHSTTPGSPDMKWYEFPLDWIPKPVREMFGVDHQVADLRSYSPQIQLGFLPDVLADVQAHTDWTKFDPEAVKDPEHYSAYMTQFMKDNYTGKYSGKKFMTDSLEAFLSMTPPTGGTRDLLDILEGKGNGMDPAAVQDAVLTMAGQYLGRYVTPVTPINDLMGQFSPEAAKARIPAEGDPEHHSAKHELLDPAISKIPGLRERIPEKIDALTGKPVSGPNPAYRQFVGFTGRVQNRLNQEMEATGLSYGQVVPRQTGDREFDNAVNKHFAELANKYLVPQLDKPAYKKLTPELKRDRLANGSIGQSGIFPQMKKAAVGLAIKELHKDPAFMKSPDARAKLKRWQDYAETISKELQPALKESQHAAELESAQEDQQEPVEEVGGPPAVPRF